MWANDMAMCADAENAAVKAQVVIIAGTDSGIRRAIAIRLLHDGFQASQVKVD